MDRPFTLLNVNDIAGRLLLSRQHTRKMCRDGELPAFKVGSDFRLDERDLIAYVEARKPKAT
jgi:excisionase family DNA binding protein